LEICHDPRLIQLFDASKKHSEQTQPKSAAFSETMNLKTAVVQQAAPRLKIVRSRGRAARRE
jgi:hypothetical protein